jgi:hypothetical protein
MGEAENSHTKAHDLSGGSQKDRGCTESTVGEIEEGSLKRALIAAFPISRA